MKKTIGVVSFIDSENYGAILQSIALQKQLERLGYKATYLNYSRKSGLKGIRRIKNAIWSWVRLFLGYERRLIKTNLFRNKNLTLSLKINNQKDLIELPDFDYYMVGSDQVWHPKHISGTNGFYLLSFVKDGLKKISYASSFGTIDIPGNLKNIYRNELSTFNEISVREKQGADFLIKMGIKSTVVLDPTLLLELSDWKLFFSKQKKIREPYIFCYVMTGDHSGARFIKSVSEEINNSEGQKYKIIVVGDKEYKKLIPGYNLITDACPSEFLNLIYNASYVVTNSFHGTCFALNFEKEFTTVLHRENLLNIRINDLLQRVSLTNRVLYTDENVTEVKLLKINYKNVNKKLSLLRNSSKSFLIDALEKNNN